MPSVYAVLGGTGQTGSQLVQQLRGDGRHIHIYARSLRGLQTKFPGIDQDPNVKLFIGDLDDIELLSECLGDADIVLSTIAQNRNEPGCSVARQTARAIISALQPRRDKGSAPTIVFLASAAVDPNSKGNRTLARRAFHWMIHHVYTDLEKANELLLGQSWLNVIIACPGALLHSSSHSVELVENTDQTSPLMSYADCARGMILMGDAGAERSGRYVGMRVNGGETIKGKPLALLRYLLPNLLAMICPPLWWLGKDYWPK